MTSNTPNKPSVTLTNSTKSGFSPVSLPESPALKSPQQNLTGLPRVARDIAADIYNNIQKWNDYHIQGANIVKQLAIIKSEATELYPTGLKHLMSELFDIVQNMSIYSNALIFLSSQMRALVKLQKQMSPLFISLTCEQLAELVDAISTAYKEEFQAKQYVLENVAHSKTKSEVMFHVSSWTHQRNITRNINLKLETILTETGHRKIKV